MEISMNILKGITEKEADNMKDMELRRIIGERAKSRRTELNLTQPYVADRLQLWIHVLVY